MSLAFPACLHPLNKDSVSTYTAWSIFGEQTPPGRTLQRWQLSAVSYHLPEGLSHTTLATIASEACHPLPSCCQFQFLECEPQKQGLHPFCFLMIPHALETCSVKNCQAIIEFKLHLRAPGFGRKSLMSWERKTP